MEHNQGRRRQFENSLTKQADQDAEYHTADFKGVQLIPKEEDESRIDLDQVWSKVSDQSQQDIFSVDDLCESVQLVTKSRKIRN